MSRIKFLLLSAILLSSCEKVNSNTCGVLIEYPQEYQTNLADEYDSLKKRGKYPATVAAIDDYGTTRASIRACLKHQ